MGSRDYANDKETGLCWVGDPGVLGGAGRGLLEWVVRPVAG